MTEENEELLIKDLYSRLLYGVECKDIYINVSGKLDEISTRYNMCRLSDEYGELETCYIPNCRPYLFPMSSMTEEQRKEYESLCIKNTSECTDLYSIVFPKDYYDTVESIDYLYKNHIDIRGLIPMGLAIDATNKNIY